MSTPPAAIDRRRIATIVGWILVATQIGNLARHTILLADTGIAPGWDLAVYRAAAVVVLRGGSPYGPGATTERLPYAYSPLLHPILPAFLGEANHVHLVYTLGAIASLILAILVLTLGLGFRGWRAAAGAWLVVGAGMSALNLDFQAGNVTSFEMLPATLLLVGVWRRQLALILPGMAFLCLAKPTWIVLALLPLVLDLDRDGLRRSIVAGVAGLSPMVLSLVVAPTQTRDWFKNAARLNEGFNIDPCLRSFFRDVFKVAHLPGSDLIWAPIALAVLILFFRFRRTLPNALAPGALAAFALLTPLFFPRLKPYSYAIPAMLLSVLLTCDRRTLRALALPIALVAFPYLITYDDDTIIFYLRMTIHRFPGGGWPMALMLLAGWLVVRWLRRERDLGVMPLPAI